MDVVLIIDESHPSWVCGLKQKWEVQGCRGYCVTPFVGVWIETSLVCLASPSWCVTPFVGVWIETLGATKSSMWVLSHPSWVCGLKLENRGNAQRSEQSHPSWVCGLKLINYEGVNFTDGESHPSWVCGLKLLKSPLHVAGKEVTPFVGVWIETDLSLTI